MTRWSFLRKESPVSQAEDYKLLLIEVPQENEQKPEAAEAMFAALHGIFREHLSFEIVSESKFIRFYIYTPQVLKDFVESQIYAQYPTVEIKEIADYTANLEPKSHWAAAELLLSKPDYFPIKTFPNFDVDPIAAITAPLSQVSQGERVWIQILIRPVREDWQNRGLAYVQAVRTGKPTEFSLSQALWNLLQDVWRTLTVTPAPTSQSPAPVPAPVEEALKGIETKVTKLGFETLIRLVSVSETTDKAKHRLLQTAAAFQQFSTINLNSFAAGPISIDAPEALADYRKRSFPKGYILNVEELASIFHLPNTAVKTPTIVWARAKKGEPPSNLPIKGEVPEEELTVFAKTNFRHMTKEFGIKKGDRRLHMYLIGKTGTGKTTMLENMVVDDMKEGAGLAVVDPHGDFIEFILDRIPSHRINDVILFNPSDFEYPIGFNLLENVEPEARNIVASGLIGIFKKIWGDISWGPRLEYILRNAILSLMSYQDATLLAIMRLLINKAYRQKVVAKLTDPVLKDFWLNEFEKYDPKFRTEAIAPIQNKVGQFLSSPIVRNIVGQPKSSFNLKEVMDEKKILLVNLSIGKIGEDNSALLGAMIITKIQLEAMARASTPEEKRADFYLYVDEFQNFATEAFVSILSEARKYHLNLILANQYIAQVPETIRNAIFGNIGTIVSFRVGAQDATFLIPEFEPVFDSNDLVNLDKYHIYLKMSIDGVTCPAFSATTLPPDAHTNPNREKITRLSRERYAKSREFVEEKINEWMAKMEEEAATKATVKIEAKTKEKQAKEPGKQAGEQVVVQRGEEEEVFEVFTDQKQRKWYLLTEKRKRVGERKGEKREQKEGRRQAETPKQNFGKEGVVDLKNLQNQSKDSPRTIEVPLKEQKPISESTTQSKEKGQPQAAPKPDPKTDPKPNLVPKTESEDNQSKSSKDKLQVLKEDQPVSFR